MAAEVVGADGGTRSVAARKVVRSSVSSALTPAPGPELLTGLLALSARDDLSARESVESPKRGRG